MKRDENTNTNELNQKTEKLTDSVAVTEKTSKTANLTKSVEAVSKPNADTTKTNLKTRQNIKYIPIILVVLISFVFMCLICIEFTGITFWKFGIAAITSEVPFGIQLD